MISDQHTQLTNGNGLIPPDIFDKRAPFELLARVASLYYLESKTQSEIAQELGLSRQKVQRLLGQAREQRIVEIHVHAIPVLHLELENKLKELFSLQDVVVAPSHPDEQYRRYSVARSVAGYLERHLVDGSVVTIGLGRNTGETTTFFQPPRQIDCTFVSAMGGSPYFGASINPNEICGRFATRSGGKSQLLYAPVYVESRRVRDMILAQDTVNQTMIVAQHASIALMGIGTPSDDAILVEAGCLSLAEVQRLRDIGAVGEILGHYYDEQGQSVNSDLDGRLIALGMDDLRKIPLVVGIASEIEKRQAILGALRAQVLHTLIIECQLALAVLRLAGVTDLKEEGTLLGI
jgi:DNA-binding transcriptional regulator LsrR (DeoR family)